MHYYTFRQTLRMHWRLNCILTGILGNHQ